jgi:hypothetical protein
VNNVRNDGPELIEPIELGFSAEPARIGLFD